MTNVLVESTADWMEQVIYEEEGRRLALSLLGEMT